MLEGPDDGVHDVALVVRGQEEECGEAVLVYGAEEGEELGASAEKVLVEASTGLIGRGWAP